VDLINHKAYNMLAVGECSDALDYASDPNNPDGPFGFKPEIFRRLYITGAYACLGRTQEAEEAFGHAEELDWPSTGNLVTLNRAGCLYNAIVEYLQVERPAKSCDPNGVSNPDESTTESTTTESTR
jgi:hypothetical protein